MFNVLQARGIPSRFLTFPDENHVSLIPASTLSGEELEARNFTLDSSY